MSAVNLGLVKFSEIEKTHYFHDPAYPDTIQFVLNGRWESYHVTWVKNHTHDPEVRRIATEAEASLPRGHEYESAPPLSIEGSSVVGDGTIGATRPSPAPSGYMLSTIPPSSPGSAGRPRLSHEVPYATPYTPQASAYAYYAAPSFAPERTQSPYSTFRSEEPSDLAPPTWRPDYEAITPAPPDGPRPPPHHMPPGGYALVVNRDAKIVLSMDGDGVRGLSTIFVVEALVNAICTRMGRSLDPHQIFDLIGGVSCTGLFAIMIGRLRMRVHEAREAYLSISRPIFVDKIRFFSSLDQNFRPPPHDGRTVEESIHNLVYQRCGTLEETFFDNRQDSTNVFVISTKVDIGFNQAAIIRSYPSRRQAGPEVPPNLTTSQAIHATLSAPTYTDPSGTDRRAVISPGFVDLGTSKNNPTKDIYYECRKLYSYTNDTMVIISVGTGRGTLRKEELKEMANAVQDRNSESKVVGEKFERDNAHLIEQGWLKYFRFNVEGMDGVPLEEGLAQQEIMEKVQEYLGTIEGRVKLWGAADAVCGVLRGNHETW